MNELQVFNNPEFGKIRAIEIDGEPWLVGKDVARALGYSNTKDALAKHVDPEDRRGSRIATPSGTQEMTVINESGLYSLIFSSRLPDAKRFKRWVTSEVLPSIRKTGSYSLPGAVQVVEKTKPEVSLIGLAKVAATARRAVLDMGGTKYEAGVEVMNILQYCGLPVPEFARKGKIFLELSDFL